METFVSAGLIATTVLIYFTRKTSVYTWLDYIRYDNFFGDKSLHTQIENISKIQDVIKILASIAKQHETDDLVYTIVSEVRDHPLTEEALMKISLLHKEFGKSDGKEGHAINLLWSSIIYAIHEVS